MSAPENSESSRKRKASCLEEEEVSDKEAANYCSICLSNKDNICKACPCSHTFCFICLVTWTKLKAPSSCPLCKQPLNTVRFNMTEDGCYDEYTPHNKLLRLKSSRNVSVAIRVGGGNENGENSDLVVISRNTGMFTIYFDGGPEDAADPGAGSATSTAASIAAGTAVFGAGTAANTAAFSTARTAARTAASTAAFSAARTAASTAAVSAASTATGTAAVSTVGTAVSTFGSAVSTAAVSAAGSVASTAASTSVVSAAVTATVAAVSAAVSAAFSAAGTAVGSAANTDVNAGDNSGGS